MSTVQVGSPSPLVPIPGSVQNDDVHLPTWKSAAPSVDFLLCLLLPSNSQRFQSISALPTLQPERLPTLVAA